MQYLKGEKLPHGIDKRNKLQFSGSLLIIISELIKIPLVGFFYYMKIQFGVNKTRVDQETNFKWHEEKVLRTVPALTVRMGVENDTLCKPGVSQWFWHS